MEIVVDRGSSKERAGALGEEEPAGHDRPATKVLIVDDHPDTGETIRLMVDLLGECGVGREKITVVVPSHEAQSDRGALTGGYTDVKLVTIAAQDSYKHRLLAGERLRPLIEQLISTDALRERW